MLESLLALLHLSLRCTLPNWYRQKSAVLWWQLTCLRLPQASLLLTVVDYALSGIQGWRYMFGVAVIPSIILAVAMWRLPDSPRWLISRSKVEQAKQVLQRVRTVSDVNPEIKDIQQSLAKQKGSGVTELFQSSLRMPLIVGVGLAIFQQITGINTVIYYAPTIFEFAGFKTAGSAILAGAGLGLLMLCMHVLAIYLMDRVGRRPLLLIGVAGQIVGMAILGAAFYFPAVVGFRRLYCYWRVGDICCLFRFWTWTGLLADDL